ncbi:MAG: PAS domain-containing protein [Planctomycetia bacterium]|nr:PAS domain-containing protein [Planctomycetia bacterium]
MPRTRLVWHLFAGWCALLAGVLAGCFWLASLHLAGLASADQRRRLVDAATAAATLSAAADGTIAPERFRERAAEIQAATGMRLELYGPDGLPLRAVAQGDPLATPNAGDAAVVAEARRGAIAAGSRYDSASGRRNVAVAVPHGPPAAPTAIILASTDTASADRELAAAQRRLLAGQLLGGAAAIAAGYALARQAARPVLELRDSAARLAAGDFAAPIPSTELAELADLSEAFTVLREQLVERGLTIGRQGTQQEAVLGSMIEGVLAIDARQRIVGLNRAAADLLGIALDGSIRRPLQDVVRNPDLRRFALKAIDCREPVEDDLVLRGPRDRTIRLRGTALRDVSGEGGAVIVLNDITDVQRLEHVRRDFVANVSHELKTPVASIKGFVETLLDGAADDPADNRRFLGIIFRQADRLAAIIEDLLALSRIEQREGAGNLPVEPTHVAAVFAAAIADCDVRAAERSISLETDCPEPLQADVNAPLLEQAIINLIDNAIKYSDPGRTVRLSAESAAGNGSEELVVRVRDQGCGIDAEHLPRLFERFYRVDKARSRKLGGTGLGLSIVKHIVQAHGGRIDVESEPGVGSAFTIRMPLHKAS